MVIAAGMELIYPGNLHPDSFEEDGKTLKLPCLLPDVPHDVYHSDPWGPSLSQSTATTLLWCPKKAWAAHPRLGATKRKAPTKEMDLGSIAHELVLGKGAGFVSLPFDDYRKDAAQEARNEVREAGLVPILAHQLEEATAAADAVRKELEALGVSLDVQTELTVLWKEGEVLCKGRLDAFLIYDPRSSAPHATIYDLKWRKKPSTADPAVFQRNCKKDGHDIQVAAYVSAIEAIYPHLAGRVSFEFLLVEQGPPVIIQPVRLAGSMRSLGQGRWKRAVKLWQKCLTSGHWPGYCDGVAEVEALPWQLQDDFAQAVRGQGDPTEAWGETETAEGGGE